MTMNDILKLLSKIIFETILYLVNLAFKQKPKLILIYEYTYGKYIIL